MLFVRTHIRVQDEARRVQWKDAAKGAEVATNALKVAAHVHIVLVAEGLIAEGAKLYKEGLLNKFPRDAVAKAGLQSSVYFIVGSPPKQVL